LVCLVLNTADYCRSHKINHRAAQITETAKTTDCKSVYSTADHHRDQQCHKFKAKASYLWGQGQGKWSSKPGQSRRKGLPRNPGRGASRMLRGLML